MDDSHYAFIYLAGTTPVEQVNRSTGAPNFVLWDSLGSVRAVISSAGNLRGETSYDAWGNPTTTGGLSTYTPFGFAGGYTDANGLVYLLARYYDPALGQFLSVDPLVEMTAAPYGYAEGDPVDAGDPDGECGCGVSASTGVGIADGAVALAGAVTALLLLAATITLPSALTFGLGAVAAVAGVVALVLDSANCLRHAEVPAGQTDVSQLLSCYGVVAGLVGVLLSLVPLLAPEAFFVVQFAFVALDAAFVANGADVINGVSTRRVRGPNPCDVRRTLGSSYRSQERPLGEALPGNHAGWGDIRSGRCSGPSFGWKRFFVAGGIGGRALGVCRSQLCRRCHLPQASVETFSPLSWATASLLRVPATTSARFRPVVCPVWIARYGASRTLDGRRADV